MVYVLLLFVFIFLVFGLVATLLVTARRNRRRRLDALHTWALVHRWRLLPTDPMVAGLRCPPVERGGSAGHTLHGADAAGRPAVAFQWSYVISRGEDDTVVTSTVVATSVPGVHPLVEVSPGRSYHAGPRAVVTGVEAFDRRFTMVTEDPGFAARAVSPTVVEWLAVDPRAGGIGFRLHGSWLVTWQPGEIEPGRVEAALAFLDDLRDEVVPEGIQGRPGGPAPLEGAR